MKSRAKWIVLIASGFLLVSILLLYKPLVKPNRIVYFSWGEWIAKRYVVKPDGTGEIKERTPNLRDGWAEWSPDGKWITYYNLMVGDQRSFVEIVHFNGRFRQRVAESHFNGGVPLWPTWSPDGQQIAYYARDDDTDTGIYTVNISCALEKNRNCEFVSQFLINGYYPDWSPGGKKILFTDHYYDAPGIFIINADGSGELENLATELGNCSHPKWSPDGSKIVLSCQGDIYTINADGTDITLLVKRGWNPQWSPDGAHISFISDRADPDGCVACGSPYISITGLYLMDADGGNITRLSLVEDIHVHWYTWVP